MKINKKIIFLIFIIILIILPLKNVYASSVGDIVSKADEFLGKGEAPGTVIDEGQLKSTSDFLYKVLLSIGIVVMFAVGIIIGIQFITASAEDKAKVKEALIPYIVGCAVVLGAFTIWSIVVNIGQSVL